jgi:hypothetical protein
VALVEFLLKLVYRPVGIVVGIFAGLLSKRLFLWAWSKIDEEEPPKPTIREVSWSKVLAASVLQGVVFSTTRTAVNRAGAEAWEWLTGVWPGKHRPEPKRD